MPPFPEAAVAPDWPAVPLKTVTVAAGGSDWQIAAVTDDDALLAVGGEDGRLPFGLKLWEGAVVLADALADRAARRPDGLTGLRVLELGCGVGLAGLAAARCGAMVTMTDSDAHVLEVARHNARVNGVESVAFREADWFDWPSGGRHDLIIGADVTYERASHAALLTILGSSLRPGGEALLTDPRRFEQAAFIAAAHERGFEVASEQRSTRDLDRPNHAIEITLIRVRPAVRAR